MSSVAPRSISANQGSENNWARAHATVTREHVTRLRVVQGSIPRALRGVVYRNGPARFERGSTTYGHLFDGDGMIGSFGFDDLGVLYRNRFVRTAAFEEEERAGEVRHRGFGTRVPGGIAANAFRTRFKNAANTGVVAHAGKLLALWEGGVPHQIDPVTLATLGPYDFQGALRAPRSVSSAVLGRDLPFCAHPKRDPSTGELVAFGARMGMRSSLLIHRVGADGAMKRAHAVALDALCFVHDFAMTPRWLVFVLCPLAFRLAPMLLGRLTPADALAGDGASPLKVMVVDRASLHGNGPPRVHVASSRSGGGFAFHVVNAFERGDTRLTVEVAWTERFPSLPSPRVRVPPAIVPPRLYGLDVDLAALHVERTPRSRSLFELPEIDARRAGSEHRVAWGLGGDATLSALTRWERGAAERLRDFAPDVVAPPIFVPRSEEGPEGDGWIVTTLYVGESNISELLVLDATTLHTTARAVLPHVLPPHFHACWAPSTGR
jgi:all-trans-8'-apo-beta-carotenal 15,15'-oxygenase